MDEVKDCSKSIQIAIFDKLIKTKDDTNIIKMFNQYNKIKNIYQTMKLNSDKNKKIFIQRLNFVKIILVI